MSDINILYTTQAKTTPVGTILPGSGNAPSSGTGVFAIGPGSFFDLLFSGANNQAEEKEGHEFPISLVLTQKSTTQDAALQTEATPSSYLQTQLSATANSEIPVNADATAGNANLTDNVAGLDIGDQPAPATEAEAVEYSAPIENAEYPLPVASHAIFPLENHLSGPAPAGQIVHLDPASQKKLAAVLENFLRGLPEDQRPVMVAIQPGQFRKIMAQMEVNASTIQTGSENLIATGLTPEQLEKLVTLIGNGKAEDGSENDGSNVAAFLIGIVKILPDNNGKEAVFIPRTLFIGKPDGNVPQGDVKAPDQELSSSLNALESAASAPANSSSPASRPADESLVSPGARDPGFGDALKSIEQTSSKSGEMKSAAHASLPESNQKNAASPGPVNSTVGTWLSGISGSLMDSTSLNSLFPDGMDWLQNPASGLSSSHLTGPAQIASIVTQAHQATSSHPTTQMVAATLIRAARNGEDQTLKLQLDPPELGRIEVHLRFSKDKTMKAHMVIEKQETMLMMQRDSQALERALQDSGISTSGDALSFELSSQGQSFSHNDNSGNGGSDRTGRSIGFDGAEIIETTMTWYVDGETGHQHYSILA